MILTVTLNPAMDKTLLINKFEIDTVNRVNDYRCDIGGKGINVSKVLNNFEINSTCTGFLGGVLEKDFIHQLNSINIETKFIHINEDTRTNIKIVDKENNTFTDINESGPNVSNTELEKFIEHFKYLCNRDDIVVLAGGVSPSIPKDIYKRLSVIAKEKGAFVILDADGELLDEGIKGIPDIIKPNNHELAKLLGYECNTDNDLINGAKTLLSKGISKIIISLGSKGALLITDGVSYKVSPLKVDVKSTVGAGDSMVAGVIYGLLNNYSDKDIIKFASACGTASVMIEGTQACTLDEVKMINENLLVTEI